LQYLVYCTLCEPALGMNIFTGKLCKFSQKYIDF
jgi:hypothetical protein